MGSDNFETLRFEVNQIAATKADIIDLKRKTNTEDFNALNKEFTNVSAGFSSNINEIKQDMQTNHARFDENITANKQMSKERLAALNEQIGQMNGTLGELQYKMKQNEKQSYEQTDNGEM